MEEKELLVVEEGTVVAKGTRKGAVFGTIFGAICFADVQPKSGYYWAKVKVPSVEEPIMIMSQYNFTKGTKVRIKYNQNNINQDGELVVDWKE